MDSQDIKKLVKQKDIEIEKLKQEIKNAQKQAAIDGIMFSYERNERERRIAYQDGKSRRNILTRLKARRVVVFNRMTSEELKQIAPDKVEVVSGPGNWERSAAIRWDDVNVEQLIVIIRNYLDVLNTPAITHNNLKNCLLKLGELLGFEAKTEFPCDNFQLDVVWSRKLAVNPTHCFEVLVSGSIFKDLAALKHANDKWMSQIFLVCAEEKDLKKGSDLLDGAFHGLEVGILDARELMEYCKYKEKFKGIDDILSK